MASLDRQRLKLLNALLFFSDNVLNAGKIKLFKLLYFLDFIHYSETGRSVTGLNYNAWQLGPVPVDLFEEWDNPRPDFNAHITRKDRSAGTGRVAQAVKAMRPPRMDIFTDREIRIMNRLAKLHFRDTAKQMIDAAHFESGPWDIVFKKQGRNQEEIPYELALLNVDAKDELVEAAREHQELLDNYG
jgi:uncharacterized phage-associated protein